MRYTKFYMNFSSLKISTRRIFLSLVINYCHKKSIQPDYTKIVQQTEQNHAWLVTHSDKHDLQTPDFASE